MFDGIVKGNEINPKPNETTGARVAKGMYLTANLDSTIDPSLVGVNALRLGDGFHDYILVNIVSCNTNAIPVGATVTSAVLTLRTSRVYSSNPFTPSPPGCCGAGFEVDMVRGR